VEDLAGTFGGNIEGATMSCPSTKALCLASCAHVQSQGFASSLNRSSTLYPRHVRLEYLLNQLSMSLLALNFASATRLIKLHLPLEVPQVSPSSSCLDGLLLPGHKHSTDPTLSSEQPHASSQLSEVRPLFPSIEGALKALQL